VTTPTPTVDLASLPRWEDEGVGARVALVDAERAAASETLTASVRRTRPNRYVIVAPRTFVFTRLRAAVVVGLVVHVGDWTGIIDITSRPVRPGDTVHLVLPAGTG
jgi:hypothetical protein